MAIEPGNANNLLLTHFRGRDRRRRLAFDQRSRRHPDVHEYSFPGFNGLVMKLAINKVGSVVTAYVDSNEPSAGRSALRAMPAECGNRPMAAPPGQCRSWPPKDIVAVSAPTTTRLPYDPTDANILYIGGNARGTCSDVLKRSADGGPHSSGTIPGCTPTLTLSSSIRRQPRWCGLRTTAASGSAPIRGRHGLAQSE